VSIVYAQEQSLSVDDYVAVLRESIMATKRPLDNRERIGRMLAGGNFIVTARENGVILGLARCVTDYIWICYCAELCVKDSAQGRGIGRGILETSWEILGPKVGFMLVSEPTAVGFYERLGMEREDTAFWRARLDRS
jgi:ribosomal protein S18 acetylase RimI-like enzyme